VRIDGRTAQILAERVLELPIPSDHLTLHPVKLKLRLTLSDAVHLLHERRKLGGHREVRPLAHERLHRAGDAASEPLAQHAPDDRPVRSGFCSEPESANSRSMILRVSTNQVWSWPERPMRARVPSVSNPGNSGTGSRLPVASSHSEEGAGRMRIPWWGRIGVQFWMPST
jgi:hypothetical protein